MPVYTYHCDNCNHEFDQRQSFSDENLTTCPDCAQDQLRKLFRPAQVVFKGSGYYVTDNRSSSKTTLNSAKSNGSSESGEKGEAEGEKKAGEKKTSSIKETKSKKTEKAS